MTQPDLSPAEEQATTPDALDLDSLTLIGLFSTNEGPAALIRAANGQVARIVPGMRTLGVTVTAIGDTQVLLTGADGVTSAVYMPRLD
ncbi:MAG: hypothetical protein II336_16990 [Loktanella sp.]|nr:hypothetical protein [Loktanella sp.]